MRILLLTRHMPAEHALPVDRGGGTDTFVQLLLALPSRFENLTIDVAAMEPEGRKVQPPDGVRIEYFNDPVLRRFLWKHREARNPFFAALALTWTVLRLIATARRLLRHHRYDLIYAVGGPIAGVSGILIKRLTGLPLAMHFQYTYNFARARKPMQWLARSFYRQADALIGNCAMLGTDAMRIGISSRKCSWVFNWIEDDLFRPLPNRAALRREWGIREDQTAFFFGGRFDRTKHVDRLIGALHGLQKEEAVFFFAGDGILRPALERLSDRNPSVHVVGTLERSALTQLHNACDVQFWGSVDVDYPGLVIIEAMYSGLPVVTSNLTMNSLYEGEPVRGDFLGVPRLARLYPPTRDGIRAAINESVDRRDELATLRPEVASFARRAFGFGNAVRLMGILAKTAGVPAPGVTMEPIAAS